MATIFPYLYFSCCAWLFHLFWLQAFLPIVGAQNVLNYGQICSAVDGIYKIQGLLRDELLEVQIEKHGTFAWIRFQSHDSFTYNMIDSYTQNIDVDVITDAIWSQITAFTYKDYLVDTDIILKWTTKGVYNSNSYIKTREGLQFRVQGSSGITDVTLVDGKKIFCNSTGVNLCGNGVLPSLNTTWSSREPLVIKEIHMNPGSSIKRKFTFQSSYYHVTIKLLNCPPIPETCTDFFWSQSLDLANNAVDGVEWRGNFHITSAEEGKMGRQGFCISANVDAGQAWLEIKLTRGAYVNTIQIMNPDASHPLGSFNISYSIDGDHYVPYLDDDGTVKSFLTPLSPTPVNVPIDITPVVGLRIIPLTSASKQCFTVELFGCSLSDLYPCQSDSCSNGGTCVFRPLLDENFECRCRPGYAGPTCEEDTCSHKCNHRGYCQRVDRPDVRFVCNCKDGYTGKLCEVVSSKISIANVWYRGCFDSVDVANAVNTDTLFEGDVGECALLCKGLGAVHMALKGGNTCLCGDFTDNGTMIDRMDCLSSTCQGHPCGNVANDNTALYSVSFRPIKPGYVGCSFTALNQVFGQFFESQNSVNVCANRCYQYQLTKDKGVLFLLFGNQCICGRYNNLQHTIALESQCSNICPGNSNERCGRTSSSTSSYRYSVYALQPESSFKRRLFKGCFHEDADQNDLDGYKMTSNTMTQDKCAKQCSNRGYRYMGIRTSTCTCGNAVGMYGEVPPTLCLAVCQGDSSQKCGNTDKNIVYDLNPEKFPRTVGCFTDTAAQHMLPHNIFLSTPWTRQESCIGSCMRFGWRYAGLWQKSYCWCGNALNYQMTIPMSACSHNSYRCYGGSESCGGNNAIIIFDLNGSQPIDGRMTVLHEDTYGTTFVRGLRNIFDGNPGTCHIVNTWNRHPAFFLQIATNERYTSAEVIIDAPGDLGCKRGNPSPLARPLVSAEALAAPGLDAGGPACIDGACRTGILCRTIAPLGDSCRYKCECSSPPCPAFNAIGIIFDKGSLGSEQKICGVEIRQGDKEGDDIYL